MRHLIAVTMKTLYTAIAFLLPFAALADLVEVIRGNDPGYMTMVEPQDVNVIKNLTFDNVEPWANTKDGFVWHGVLQGMQTKCLETDRNPCTWPNETQCVQTGTGMKPIGRIFDDPKPTLPFTPVQTEQGGSFFLYGSNQASPLLDGAKPFLNFSRFGCEELGRSDWGDGPWSIVFPEPYTAVCLGVRFERWDDLRHQHFNAWGEQNGESFMVGHRDLFGEPGWPRDRLFCWVSDVPFSAITTWQDGPGTHFIKVLVGEPATTECERATRTADDAADDAVQACQ